MQKNERKNLQTCLFFYVEHRTSFFAVQDLLLSDPVNISLKSLCEHNLYGKTKQEETLRASSCFQQYVVSWCHDKSAKQNCFFFLNHCICLLSSLYTGDSVGCVGSRFVLQCKHTNPFTIVWPQNNPLAKISAVQYKFFLRVAT